MPSAMSSRRPAALMRGAMAKPMSAAVSVRGIAARDFDQCAQTRRSPALRAAGAGPRRPGHGCWHPAAPGRRRCRPRPGRAAPPDPARAPASSRCVAQVPAQGQQHVEHHADASEHLAGEGVAAQVRIDDGIGRRQRLAGQVVVGDQHLPTARLGRGDAGMAGDAVVDGDQQVRLQRGQVLDQARRQAVAVDDAIGHRVATRGARPACAGRARRPRRRWRRRNRSRRPRRYGGPVAIASASRAVAASSPPMRVGRQQSAPAAVAPVRAAWHRVPRWMRCNSGWHRRPVAFDCRRFAATYGAKHVQPIRRMRRGSCVECRQRLAPEPPALAPVDAEAAAVLEVQAQASSSPRCTRGQRRAPASRSRVPRHSRIARRSCNVPASIGANPAGSGCSLRAARPTQAPAISCRPSGWTACGVVTWSGRIPPPQNHSELTGGLPAATRAALCGWLCSTTWASLSSARQRRPSGPFGQMLEAGRAPRASAGAANTGSFDFARQAQVPAGRCRRIDGEAGIAEQRAQGRQQRLDVGLAELHGLVMRQQARAVDVRAHVHRIGTQPCGQGAASPASNSRVNAATGQPRGSRSKWRSSCARSPGSPTCRAIGTAKRARDRVGQRLSRETRARRQQQRRGGHGLRLRTGRR